MGIGRVVMETIEPSLFECWIVIAVVVVNPNDMVTPREEPHHEGGADKSG
jgi:hypothetical protein